MNLKNEFRADGILEQRTGFSMRTEAFGWWRRLRGGRLCSSRGGRLLGAVGAQGVGRLGTAMPQSGKEKCCRRVVRIGMPNMGEIAGSANEARSTKELPYIRQMLSSAGSAALLWHC